MGADSGAAVALPESVDRADGRSVIQSVPTAARARVLTVAEDLFTERGYTAVTLRDIAGALGMRQASLYHHAPGGKEQLYVEVTERGLERHRLALEAAIAGAGLSLQTQLLAAAGWLLSQSPIDLQRMNRSDMPSISPEHAERLEQQTYRSLLLPLDRAFRAAAERGEVRLPAGATLLAGAFLSIIEGLHDARRFARHVPAEMAAQLVTVLLDGLRPR